MNYLESFKEAIEHIEMSIKEKMEYGLARQGIPSDKLYNYWTGYSDACGELLEHINDMKEKM